MNYLFPKNANFVQANILFCTIVEELAVVCSVFDKHEMLEESTATEIDVKTNLFDINSITRISKLEPDCLERSDGKYVYIFIPTQSLVLKIHLLLKYLL